MSEPTVIRQATTRDFLSVVFRQLWVIVTVFLIAVVSVIVVSWRSPTVYESESRVLVSRGRKQSVLNPNIQVFTWEEEVSSEIETVKSFPVAQRAQKILDEQAARGEVPPIKIQRSGVDAGVVEKSNVIKISYTSRHAETCVDVTNAFTQAYMDFRKESTTVPYVTEFFTREIASVDSAMADVLARRGSFLERTGTVAPVEERHQLFGLMQEAESDLMEVQQSLRVTNENLRRAKEYLDDPDGPDPAYFASLDLGNSTSFQQLRQKLNDLEQEREALLPSQTPEHPQLKGIMRALTEVKEQVRREAIASIELIEGRGASLRERERVLDGLVQSYRSQLQVIPERETTLDALDHEMTTLRDRYKELVGKEIQARISQATSPDFTVTLFSPAGRPIALRTTDYVRLGLAPILSLVVGLMLAFFLDNLDHSLKSATDVEEYLGIPVLASLPESKS